jgi:hypothetical protein
VGERGREEEGERKRKRKRERGRESLFSTIIFVAKEVFN